MSPNNHKGQKSPKNQKFPIHRCTFPGCNKQIRPSARFCSKHWGQVWDEKKNKRSQGKTEAEIIYFLSNREKGRTK